MAHTESYYFRGVACAVSAIAHFGDSAGGTDQPFRREDFCVDGEMLSIPVISGNSFRGMLRDKGMYFMLKVLGFGEEEAIKLSVPAFHLLTSGGALSKDTGRGIPLGEERRLREMIPLLGIFGGATGRNIMHGKLYMGKWYVICKEMKQYLPEEYHDHPKIEKSFRQYLSIQRYSRKDDAKDYQWHQFIEGPQEQLDLLTAPKKETAKDGTEVAIKDVAQQMRYGFETLSAGTEFSCWIQLNDVTKLEFEAFASSLVEWSKAPMIGGQHRHGCGLVALTFDEWHSVSPLAQRKDESQAVGLPLGESYVSHLQEHKREILDLLKGVA